MVAPRANVGSNVHQKPRSPRSGRRSRLTGLDADREITLSHCPRLSHEQVGTNNCLSFNNLQRFLTSKTHFFKEQFDNARMLHCQYSVSCLSSPKNSARQYQSPRPDDRERRKNKVGFQRVSRAAPDADFWVLHVVAIAFSTATLTCRAKGNTIEGESSLAYLFFQPTRIRRINPDSNSQ